MEKEIKGRIVKALGLYYTVSVKKKLYNCVLRGKLRQSKKWKKYTNPVAVGDIVSIIINPDGNGVIDQIYARKNVFSRKEKGRAKREDIIAVNLDYIVIIQSFADPLINLRFVDRLAVRGFLSNIPILLCINKIDLIDKEFISYVYDYYKNAPIDIIMISAAQNKGLDVLKNKLIKKRSIFVGFSGVGKTTILNKLYPELNLKTAEISAGTGKGKHTTTNVFLIECDKSEIIDTPGVREFGLMDIEPPFLSNYFYEFSDYSSKCNFSPCTHDHEPNCYVKKMVADGNIYNERYISYLNILHSLIENHKNFYK